MTKKKKCIIFAIVAGAILETAIALALVVLLNPFTLLYIGNSQEPPKPAVTYGEFPFELVYEIDGERIAVKDTLVIEYDGVGGGGSIGKYNKWAPFCESQRGTGKYLKDYDKLILFSGSIKGSEPVTIKFDLGSCAYYMGVEETQTYYEHLGIQPGDIVISSRAYTGPISDEELYENYNIKIIKKTISPPISKR